MREARYAASRMLLPIGDEPNDPDHLAWMTYVLIGANVIGFALARMQGEAFESVLTSWAFAPRDPSAATLLASMFLHVGWMHLLGNMLFLWVFGRNVEAHLGPWGYLASYVALGCFAALIHGLFADAPIVGASGAVSGVQGLYFVACPRHRVRMLFWLYFFITALHVNARLVMLFWFVMQDVIPSLLQMRAHVGDRVAHMAHLGGFVSGLGLMFVLQRLVPTLRRPSASETLHEPYVDEPREP